MPGEQYLLVSTQNPQPWSAALYDHETGNLLRTYKNGGIAAPKTLTLLSDDYIFAAESNKPLLHVWQLNSQEVTKNLRLVLPEPAQCVAVCPDNFYVAVGIGPTVYLWTVNGKLVSVQKKHYQAVSCVCFSSDGKYLIVGGFDGMLLVYKLSDLISLLAQHKIGDVDPLYTFRDHSLDISGLYAGKFGKQSHVATVSTDQSCRLYNLITGSHLLTIIFPEPLTCVVFDLCYFKLFVGSQSGNIYQYNLANAPRTVEHHIDPNKPLILSGHKNKVQCLDINLTNNLLASCSKDNTVFIWTIEGQQIHKKLEFSAPVENLKFVMAHEKFTSDSFKPNIVLKPFERIQSTKENFGCFINQGEDLEMSDDENDGQKELERSNLRQQNVKLRVINKQLYDMALDLNKKLNN